MKILKVFLSILFWLVIFFSVLLFIYSLSIKSNMKRLNNEANIKWEELFNLTTQKNKILKNYYLMNVYKPNKEQILLIETLNNNLKERIKYKNHCQVEFTYMEYALNKLIVNNKMKIVDKKYDEMINKVNFELNEEIKLYNNAVLNFNEYYTLFPNVLIAKHLGLKRKKFFNIKYGVSNDDPIEKEKELPQWALGVDTTFIKH